MNLEYCALDALFVQRIKVKFNVEDIEDVKKKKKFLTSQVFPLYTTLLLGLTASKHKTKWLVHSSEGRSVIWTPVILYSYTTEMECNNYYISISSYKVM